MSVEETFRSKRQKYTHTETTFYSHPSNTTKTHPHSTTDQHLSHIVYNNEILSPSSPSHYLLDYLKHHGSIQQCESVLAGSDADDVLSSLTGLDNLTTWDMAVIDYVIARGNIESIPKTAIMGYPLAAKTRAVRSESILRQTAQSLRHIASQIFPRTTTPNSEYVGYMWLFLLYAQPDDDTQQILQTLSLENNEKNLHRKLDLLMELLYDMQRIFDDDSVLQEGISTIGAMLEGMVNFIYAELETMMKENDGVLTRVIQWRPWTSAFSESTPAVVPWVVVSSFTILQMLITNHLFSGDCCHKILLMSDDVFKVVSKSTIEMTELYVWKWDRFVQLLEVLDLSDVNSQPPDRAFVDVLITYVLHMLHVSPSSNIPQSPPGPSQHAIQATPVTPSTHASAYASSPSTLVGSPSYTVAKYSASVCSVLMTRPSTLSVFPMLIDRCGPLDILKWKCFKTLTYLLDEVTGAAEWLDTARVADLRALVECVRLHLRHVAYRPLLGVVFATLGTLICCKRALNIILESRNDPLPVLVSFLLDSHTSTRVNASTEIQLLISEAANDADAFSMLVPLCGHCSLVESLVDCIERVRLSLASANNNKNNTNNSVDHEMQICANCIDAVAPFVRVKDATISRQATKAIQKLVTTLSNDTFLSILCDSAEEGILKTITFILRDAIQRTPPVDVDVRFTSLIALLIGKASTLPDIEPLVCLLEMMCKSKPNIEKLHQGGVHTAVLALLHRAKSQLGSMVGPRVVSIGKSIERKTTLS